MFLSPFLSLKAMKKMFSGEDFKKKRVLWVFSAVRSVKQKSRERPQGGVECGMWFKTSVKFYVGAQNTMTKDIEAVKCS